MLLALSKGSVAVYLLAQDSQDGSFWVPSQVLEGLGLVSAGAS